jgi:hypothetical protein
VQPDAMKPDKQQLQAVDVDPLDTAAVNSYNLPFTNPLHERIVHQHLDLPADSADSPVTVQPCLEKRVTGFHFFILRMILSWLSVRNMLVDKQGEYIYSICCAKSKTQCK